MKVFKTRGKILTLLCCFLLAGACADVSVDMHPDEWVWDAGGISTFSGTIRTDGADLSGTVLKLSIESSAEDPGTVQFTNLNGKKLTKRKRSDTAAVDIPGGNEDYTFEAEWILPSESDESIMNAAFRLSVSDADGKELKSVAMRPGATGEEETAAPAAARQSLPHRLVFFLSVSAAAVWILAIARHIFLNRNKKKRA